MAAPSTYRQNTTNTPIDGIWTSRGLEIITGGYFGMDEVIPSTDHRCLWIDISQSIAFGQGGMPPIIKPAAPTYVTTSLAVGKNTQKIAHYFSASSIWKSQYKVNYLRSKLRNMKL
jgi:hypothetical protein